MPNMKVMIEKGYANAMNFEHPYYYDENLVDNLHVEKYKTQYHELLLNAEDVLHLKLFEQFKTAINDNTLNDPKTLIALSQLQNAKTALKDLDEFFEHFKSKSSSMLSMIY